MQFASYVRLEIIHKDLLLFCRRTIRDRSAYDQKIGIICYNVHNVDVRGERTRLQKGALQIPFTLTPSP